MHVLMALGQWGGVHPVPGLRAAGQWGRMHPVPGLRPVGRDALRTRP